MLKITRMADYAVVILVSMATDAGRDRFSASMLSVRTRLPEPTVAKVLKRLSAENIIESTRGAGGGYKLSRTPDAIAVCDIIAAVDGPIALTACANDDENLACDYGSVCAVKGRWNKVNDAVKTALKEITLRDMLPDTHRSQGDFAQKGVWS